MKSTASRTDELGRSKSLAQPQRNERARRVVAKRAGKGGGAAPLRMRTKTPRRKWCAGSGGVKTFREGGGRGGQPGSRIGGGGGGGGDSGGAGRGSR